MVEPLFMRFIIDRVLLNTELDLDVAAVPASTSRAWPFVAVVILSNLIRVLKDYRQRLLNTQVMLTLRRSLFDRLLHLPLPKLWDMKTGGILSRLTGDVDTTTGLMQMAVISPSVSLVRLIIAVTVLMLLNWRLALTALAIIPGVMAISFVFSRRVRPIYRTVRKDVERVDGRVGETFSGIRVVRAFARETRELRDYMLGRHTVLRKELFAHRRELLMWTSWGMLVGGDQRRDRLVRRLPERRRPRLHRRHHGVPVVHVPADEPGLEHRQLLLGAAALAGGHGARLRSAGHGGRQARPAGRARARRRLCTRSSSRTSSSNIAKGSPVVRDFNVPCPAARSSPWSAGAARERRR